MSVGNEQSQMQVEELFNEVNTLIKTHGLAKALLQVRILNSGKNNADIDLYEFIIKTTCESFDVSEKELFYETTHYKSTDARRTVYVLIERYFNFKHKSIGFLFGKSRSTVTTAISEYMDMQKDRGFYTGYLDSHEKIEMKVTSFIKKSKKN